MDQYQFVVLTGLLGIAFLPLCSWGQEQTTIVRIDSITYCRMEGVDLGLDVARPARSDSSHPGLLFIHGGGWREGTRAQFRDEIEDAARNGYVAATLSHRLTEPTTEEGTVKHPWPAAIHDVKCAIQFLRANADRFHLESNKIGITGHSSGGHLALLAGLTDESDSLEGPGRYPEVSSRVQAVVSMSGPTHMTSVYAAPVVKPYAERFMTAPPEQRPERYRRASPTQYVSADDPPIMIIHGENDDVVPVGQAKKLDRELASALLPHTLLVLDEQPHVYRGEGAQKAQRRRRSFFRRHLKK